MYFKKQDVDLNHCMEMASQAGSLINDQNFSHDHNGTSDKGRKNVTKTLKKGGRGRKQVGATSNPSIQKESIKSFSIIKKEIGTSKKHNTDSVYIIAKKPMGETSIPPIRKENFKPFFVTRKEIGASKKYNSETASIMAKKKVGSTTKSKLKENFKPFCVSGKEIGSRMYYSETVSSIAKKSVGPTSNPSMWKESFRPYSNTGKETSASKKYNCETFSTKAKKPVGETSKQPMRKMKFKPFSLTGKEMGASKLHNSATANIKTIRSIGPTLTPSMRKETFTPVSVTEKENGASKEHNPEGVSIEAKKPIWRKFNPSIREENFGAFKKHNSETISTKITCYGRTKKSSIIAYSDTINSGKWHLHKAMERDQIHSSEIDHSESDWLVEVPIDRRELSSGSSKGLVCSHGKCIGEEREGLDCQDDAAEHKQQEPGLQSVSSPESTLVLGQSPSGCLGVKLVEVIKTENTIANKTKTKPDISFDEEEISDSDLSELTSDSDLSELTSDSDQSVDYPIFSRRKNSTHCCMSSDEEKNVGGRWRRIIKGGWGRQTIET